MMKLNGKQLRPGDLEKALMQAAVGKVKAHLRERLGAIRLPSTGEFPTIVILGDTIDNLKVSVEGSPELLALVRERLDPNERKGITFVETQLDQPPRAFLSYAWEDRALAKMIAEGLQANGIDTWWAEWEIGAGDSLRQKIDEGLAGCTHFIVLLTPASVSKPWVNQEMDAGLARKLHDSTKFIAVRHNLPVTALPPLLAGSLSPEINDMTVDLRQLVNDIHGVSRKPVLGQPPAVATVPRTDYSPAATAIAKVFVEASETATFGDPQFTLEELSAHTALSVDDVEDALHELKGLIRVSLDRALAEDELFACFDRHFMEWNPVEDAVRLAADLVNDASFPESTAEIAARYGWPPRRINPAIAYLLNRDVIRNSRVLGSAPWITAWVDKTDATRRFVKSRS